MVALYALAALVVGQAITTGRCDRRLRMRAIHGMVDAYVRSQHDVLMGHSTAVRIVDALPFTCVGELEPELLIYGFYRKIVSDPDSQCLGWRSYALSCHAGRRQPWQDCCTEFDRGQGSGRAHL